MWEDEGALAALASFFLPHVNGEIMQVHRCQKSTVAGLSMI